MIMSQIATNILCIVFILISLKLKEFVYRTPSTFLNPSSLSKPFHLSSKGARIPVKTSVGEVWFETDPNSV
jgi:hypothetical protein